MNVGIDCDGVVRNLMIGAYRALKQLRPTLFKHLHDSPADPPEYDMDGMMRTYDEDVAATLNEVVFGGGQVTRMAYRHAPMTEDAEEALHRAVARMRDGGARVHICTKQPTAEQQACTAEWLERNDVPFDGLVFTSSDKSSFGLDWLIDDRYRHILEITRAGGTGVLRTRRHNRFDRRRCRHVVDGLSEFADLVCDAQSEQ